MDAPRAFIERIDALVGDFTKSKAHFQAQAYSESQARLDFIDKLFEALGWSIRLQPGTDPIDRDVVVERGATKGRPDYSFRIERATKFFVEAKAPHVDVSRPDVILQAKKYAWNNTEEVVYFSAVTNFQEFRFYDASRKPDPRHPGAGLIFAHSYQEYVSPIGSRHLWQLSREAVAEGSLDTLISPAARVARTKTPLDQEFLSDLSDWREKLAKSVYKTHPDFHASDVNSVVQMLLDRLIFIRIAEDRGFLPPDRLREMARLWREEGRQRPIAADLLPIFQELNKELNGEIFKPHPCELVKWDSSLIVEIIMDGLEPYNFAQIGVELLGYIYERYLGKTIRVTATRVIVEEKREVRKAGGVYYTPKYVVDQVVKDAIGTLVEGKSPLQISKLRFIDPACGSGSFLLGAYRYLLDYHLKWYLSHPKVRPAPGQPELFVQEELSEPRLTVEEKGRILKNNIFGVDLDQQAVEITMMSLYVKLLEGEKNLTHKQALLPSLSSNIRWGNSLISSEFRKYDNESPVTCFDWDSNAQGFGSILQEGRFHAVIGNPPYVQLSMMEYYNESVNQYIKRTYASSMGRLNTFGLFIQRAVDVMLAEKGILSYIVPNTILTQEYYQQLRRMILDNTLVSVTSYRYPVFSEAVVETVSFVLKKGKTSKNQVRIVDFDNRAFTSQEKLVSQSVFESTHKNAISVNADESLMTLKGKLDLGSIRLVDLVNLNQAIALKEDRSASLFKKKVSQNYKPVLDGRNVERYAINWDGWYIAYDVTKIHSCKRTDIFETSEKILFRRVGNRLIAAIDCDRHYALNTLVVITPKSQDCPSLRFLLGIINSSLLNFYYTTYLKSTKKVFSEIQARQLAQIPIRIPDPNSPPDVELAQTIERQVDMLISLRS